MFGQQQSLRMQCGSSWLILVLTVFCCLVLSSTQHYSFMEQLSRDPIIHAVNKKSGNMDLAFMQMYQLCDRNRDGAFSPSELRCLRELLRVLFGSRGNK